MTFTGWAFAAIVSVMMGVSASFKFAQPEWFTLDWTSKFGYGTELALGIGIAEVACVLIFLFPRTAVLGAILLTGYLGGAVATHVRIHDNFIPPAVFGVFVWLSLYLRDARIRALLPLRSTPTPSPGPAAEVKAA